MPIKIFSAFALCLALSAMVHAGACNPAAPMAAPSVCGPAATCETGTHRAHWTPLRNEFDRIRERHAARVESRESRRSTRLTSTCTACAPVTAMPGACGPTLSCPGCAPSGISAPTPMLVPTPPPMPMPAPPRATQLVPAVPGAYDALGELNAQRARRGLLSVSAGRTADAGGGARGSGTGSEPNIGARRVARPARALAIASSLRALWIRDSTSLPGQRMPTGLTGRDIARSLFVDKGDHGPIEASLIFRGRLFDIPPRSRMAFRSLGHERRGGCSYSPPMT
jgi:hypothetical protein